MGVVKTGDAVEIVERGEGWTQIRVASLGTGWIPVGYLQSEPPARVRLAQSEAQTSEFRDQLDLVSSEAERLKQENEKLAARDEEQRASIDRLGRENFELRAGARWPEWITGASILVVGMIVGALLHRNATRRPSSRIRI